MAGEYKGNDGLEVKPQGISERESLDIFHRNFFNSLSAPALHLEGQFIIEVKGSLCALQHKIQVVEAPKLLKQALESKALLKAEEPPFNTEILKHQEALSLIESKIKAVSQGIVLKQRDLDAAAIKESEFRQKQISLEEDFARLHAPSLRCESASTTSDKVDFTFSGVLAVAGEQKEAESAASWTQTQLAKRKGRVQKRKASLAFIETAAASSPLKEDFLKAPEAEDVAIASPEVLAESSVSSPAEKKAVAKAEIQKEYQTNLDSLKLALQMRIAHLSAEIKLKEEHKKRLMDGNALIEVLETENKSNLLARRSCEEARSIQTNVEKTQITKLELFQTALEKIREQIGKLTDKSNVIAETIEAARCETAGGSPTSTQKSKSGRLKELASETLKAMQLKATQLKLNMQIKALQKIETKLPDLRTEESRILKAIIAVQAELVVTQQTIRDLDQELSVCQAALKVDEEKAEAIKVKKAELPKLIAEIKVLNDEKTLLNELFSILNLKNEHTLIGSTLESKTWGDFDERVKELVPLEAAWTVAFPEAKLFDAGLREQEPQEKALALQKLEADLDQHHCLMLSQREVCSVLMREKIALEEDKNTLILERAQKANEIFHLAKCLKQRDQRLASIQLNIEELQSEVLQEKVTKARIFAEKALRYMENFEKFHRTYLPLLELSAALKTQMKKCETSAKSDPSELGITELYQALASSWTQFKTEAGRHLYAQEQAALAIQRAIRARREEKAARLAAQVQAGRNPSAASTLNTLIAVTVVVPQEDAQSSGLGARVWRFLVSLLCCFSCLCRRGNSNAVAPETLDPHSPALLRTASVLISKPESSVRRNSSSRTIALMVS